MHDINLMLEEMRMALPSGPVRIKEAKEAGTKVVGTYCVFSPYEVIRAAGAIPASLCATSEKPISAAEEHLPSNLCPLIKASYGFALTDTCPYFHFCDLVLGETTCDGKKKMYELMNRLRPVHVMQLPQTVNDIAIKQWQAEIERFAQRLEDEFKVHITEEDLRREIKKRNEERKIMMDFYALAKLNPAPFTGREIYLVSEYFKISFGDSNMLNFIKELTQKARENYENGERRVPAGKKRIIVTGCPVGKSVEKVFDAIEENGGLIVAFENCTALKPLYELVDETLPPYEALAKKYLHIPCSCMTPNTARLELLENLKQEYQADGVVDLVLQACHTYSVESYQVHERMRDKGAACITIETDYYQGDKEQLNTRMGAFIEMME
ncbi:MAG: 2-hydroxyacyl-CoA dehydratase [Synergistaceae bacterium]|nr:2-hydroxyacyl-CoA dehydratase [Synergistaceae bacterium]